MLARACSEATRRLREVNSGFLAFRWAPMLAALLRVTPSPVSGELYLTDAVREIRRSGGSVVAVPMDDPVEMLGANTPEQLDAIARERARRTAGRR